MDINKIFEYNKNWINSKLKSDSRYFENLSKSQNPEILYIGCSDSRVAPHDILGLELGEAFAHRNIANLVSVDDLNAMSVIRFAIRYLDIKHIIICGHYNCAGVKSAMNSDPIGDLEPWINKIREVYTKHRKKLEAIENNELRYKSFVELNVAEQCVNILKIEEVQKAFKIGNLKIHGWVFDLNSGNLIDLKIDCGKILAAQ